MSTRVGPKSEPVPASPEASVAQRVKQWRSVRGLGLVLNGPIAIAVVLFMLGALITRQNYLLQGSVALTYAIAATGLGLALGLGGEFLLGQLALFAVGAYVTAALVQPQHGWNFWPAAAAGVAAATVVGLAMSVIALRVSRFYFALVGFFLVSLAPNIVTIFASQTGGTAGLPIVTVPHLFGVTFGTKQLFWMAGFFLVVSLMLVRNVREAPLGIHMRKMRENPATLTASGIPVWRVRIPTYVLSGLLAGVGGAIYCELYAYLLPNFFDLNATVLLFAAVLVGGATTLFGPAIGVILLYVIPTIVISAQSYSDFIYGGIVVASVILFRGGVERAATDLYRQLRRRHKERREPGSEPARPVQPPHSDLTTTSHGDYALLARMLWELREGEPALGEFVVRGAQKHFGGVAALDFAADDQISIIPGQVHSLLGPNGSGKTTLLNVTSGLANLDEGAVTLGGVDVTTRSAAKIARMGVSRSFQSPSLPPEVTPRQLLGASLAHMRGLSYFHWLTSDPIAARARRIARDEAGEILVAAGLPDAIDEPCSALTSGQTRILDVLLALTSRSTIVMLDEPAAGLSEVERKRLAATIRSLAEHGLGFLVVEHDIELALGIADHVTVLGQGRVLAAGTPDHIKDHEQVREVLIGAGR